MGVGPDDLVGVCTDRSADMVTSLLAILKAGGAYLPLDPQLPAERFRFILDDAQARWIVTQSRLAGRLPSSDARCVCVDGEAEVDADESNPTDGAGDRHLAYVLYTSGSTGRPKGVAVEHRSAVNFIDWARRTFSPEDVAGMLASTSIGFDLSVFELFTPLSCGGQVILADDALALPGLPAASAVTLINTVPSAMTELLRLGRLPPSVRVVGMGGEALPHPLARRIYQEESVQRVYNLYGPTETTVYSTAALVPKGAPEPPTIGRPIANTRVYVLDAHGSPTPVGVPGELYIGGAGLARGYLRREELTADKFVADPFGDAPGGRLYRTGDLVRWLPGGELEYLGRLDHQVKIRGFRIEPGEIETVLRQHPTVRQAVVTAREDIPGDRRPGRLRGSRRPRRALPAGVARTFAIASARIHGAVGVRGTRRAASDAQRQDRPQGPAAREPAAPEPEGTVPFRTPTEEIVAGVWADVLRIPGVGAHDNFFELGGHSLLAARVISRLRGLFSVDLPVRALFEAPTTAELAARIDAARAAGEASADEPIRPAARRRAAAALLRPAAPVVPRPVAGRRRGSTTFPPPFV